MGSEGQNQDLGDPDHKTRKVTELTRDRRQQRHKTSDRLDKTAHSDVAPVVNPCAAVDWPSRSYWANMGISMLCDLHCTVWTVRASAQLSDETPPV